jgi:hypothetical protein
VFPLKHSSHAVQVIAILGIITPLFLTDLPMQPRIPLSGYVPGPSASADNFSRRRFCTVSHSPIHSACRCLTDLYAKRKCLGRLFDTSLHNWLQWLNSPGLVEVNDRVKLVRKSCLKIVTG